MTTMTYEARRKRYRAIKRAAGKIAQERLARRVQRRRDAEFDRDFKEMQA